MALQLVHGSPYAAVRSLAAWAVYRQGYLRGRLLLNGIRWDALGLAERVDVAHAAMIEPIVHGSWTSIDAVLDKFEEIFEEAAGPNRETFGLGAEAQRGAERARTIFGEARPMPNKRRRPRRAVGSGHPLETGLTLLLAGAQVRSAPSEHHRIIHGDEPERS